MSVVWSSPLRMACLNLPACSPLLNEALLTRIVAVRIGKSKADVILLHGKMGVANSTHHFVSNSVRRTALESPFGYAWRALAARQQNQMNEGESRWSDIGVVGVTLSHNSNSSLQSSWSASRIIRIRLSTDCTFPIGTAVVDITQMQRVMPSTSQFDMIWQVFSLRCVKTSLRTQ